MAEAVHHYSSAIRCTMREMTALVRAISETTLPSLHLPTHILELKVIHTSFMTGLHIRPSITNQLILISESEETRFSSTFTTLLTEVVPQLKRLGSFAAQRTEMQSLEEDVFWNLWVCLATVVNIFGDWPARAQGPQQLSKPLFSAIHALLVWLLRLTQSPAWLNMTEEHGLHSRNHELVSILGCPLLFLIKAVSLGQKSDLIRHLHNSTPDFMSLQCCIMSEQLGGFPLQQPTQHRTPSQQAFSHSIPMPCPKRYTGHKLFSQLIKVMTHLTDEVAGPRAERALAQLRRPAIVHALKVVFLLLGTPQPPTPNFDDSSLQCLTLMLSAGVTANGDKVARPVSDGQRNRDAAGLPWHLHPMLSTRVLSTDLRLLHALGAVGAGRAETQLQCYQIQVRIVRGWLTAGESCRVPVAALAAMVGGVVGIAKQRSTGVLLMMREMRGAASPPQVAQRLPGQHSGDEANKSSTGRQLQQNPECPHKLVVAPSGESVLRIRDLLSMASSFNMHTPDGGFHSTLGKFA